MCIPKGRKESSPETPSCLSHLCFSHTSRPAVPDQRPWSHFLQAAGKSPKPIRVTLPHELPGQLTSAAVHVTVAFRYCCCVTGLLCFLDPHINDNVERSSSSVWLSSLSAGPSEREYCTGAPCRDPGHPARPAPPSFQSAPFSAPPSGSTPWNRKALPSDGARPALHSFIQHLFCGRPP